METPAGVARWQFVSPGSEGAEGAFETSFLAGSYQLSFMSDSVAEGNIKRAFGCLVMAFMPEEGLDETLGALKETYDFYAEERDASLVEPVTMVHEGIGVGSGGRSD